MTSTIVPGSADCIAPQNISSAYVHDKRTDNSTSVASIGGTFRTSSSTSLTAQGPLLKKRNFAVTCTSVSGAALRHDRIASETMKSTSVSGGAVTAVRIASGAPSSSSNGYIETADDDIDDSSLLNLFLDESEFLQRHIETVTDGAENSTLLDVISDQSIASQGYVEPEDENVDLELVNVVEGKKTYKIAASLPKLLGRHYFNFTNCPITFNFID